MSLFLDSTVFRTDTIMENCPMPETAGHLWSEKDWKAGRVKTAGDPQRQFQENPLLILQGIRLAVTCGMSIEPVTQSAMRSQAGNLEKLDPACLFEELSRLLPVVKKEDLQRFAPILAAAIPELKPMIGFDQRSPHHGYDLYTHVAGVVESVPGDLALRWAALLHDVGKVPTFTLDETGRGHFRDHAAKGAEMADAILKRLKAPDALRKQVVLLIEKHMLWLVPEKMQLRSQLGQLGLETVYQILSLQQADNSNKGTVKSGENEKYVRILETLEEIRSEDGYLSLKDLAVTGDDLVRIGFSGRTIGLMLNWMLDQVQEEKLPNERGVLLGWANHVWDEAWRNT